MEIITIESKAFKLLAEKIDKIYHFISSSNSLDDDFLENILLDTNEVCELLEISDRTLWKLRKENLIEFTYQGKKCIYEFSELEKLISNKMITCGIKSTTELRNKYLLANNSITNN